MSIIKGRKKKKEKKGSIIITTRDRQPRQKEERKKEEEENAKDRGKMESEKEKSDAREQRVQNTPRSLSVMKGVLEEGATKS